VSHLPSTPPLSDRLVCYFRSGEAIRSRSVSEIVLSATLAVPSPPARLLTDWERETNLHMGLKAGDVEAMPLARTRARWSDYPRCVQTAAEWTQTLGLGALLSQSEEIALMACRGARYHHDATQYGHAVFCNLFLSEDKGLDLLFAASGQRIPLVKGCAVIFDTGQAHAVVKRGSDAFRPADFLLGHDCTQVFLTWELPIEAAPVARALQVRFDIDTPTAWRLNDPQLVYDGTRVSVCPDSGQWQPATD
jgi:hypothetical protein